MRKQSMSLNDYTNLTVKVELIGMVKMFLQFMF